MTARSSRPLPVSGALSVLAGLVAVLFVANGPGQRFALATAVLGVVALALGVEATHRGHVLLGTVTASGGLAVVLVALLLSVTRTGTIIAKLELLPGIVGLAVLGLGVASAVPGRERWFVNAGTGAILLSVFVSGLLYDASVLALLAGTAATVVAWDSAEQSINMAEQVGREARTWRVEVVHGGGAVLVAGAAVGLAAVVNGVGVSGIPLAGLSVLLGAGVVLSVALYN